MLRPTYHFTLQERVMDRKRLGKIWTVIKTALALPAGLLLAVIFIIEMFSRKAGDAEGMPTWQFLTFLVPIIAIFVLYSYLQRNKADQSPPEPATPYVMSAGLRRLGRLGLIFAFIGAFFMIVMVIPKLADGVGSRDWLKNLCLLVISITVMPTWIHWALLRQKAPKTA